MSLTTSRPRSRYSYACRRAARMRRSPHRPPASFAVEARRAANYSAGQTAGRRTSGSSVTSTGTAAAREQAGGSLTPSFGPTTAAGPTSRSRMADWRGRGGTPESSPAARPPVFRCGAKPTGSPRPCGSGGTCPAPGAASRRAGGTPTPLCGPARAVARSSRSPTEPRRHR